MRPRIVGGTILHVHGTPLGHIFFINATIPIGRWGTRVGHSSDALVGGLVKLPESEETERDVVSEIFSALLTKARADRKHGLGCRAFSRKQPSRTMRLKSRF